MKNSMIVLLTFTLALCLMSQAVTADDFKPFPASLKGKKIAIFLDNQYQTDEAFYTPLRLKEAGADVKIVSHESPYVYRDNHRVYTDITPQEAVKTKWDGFVVIGGFSPLEIREDRDVISIVKNVNNRGGMVSAICHGVCVLVTADVIRGKTVTGNLPRQIEFTNAGATFIDKAPQIDDNVITAISPADNGPYLDAMVNWFDGGEASAKAHLEDQYLKGKKIAIVIDGRYDYDQIKYPLIRLRHNGADVSLVAKADGTYKEYRGQGSYTSDLNAQDASIERFDAVILPSHWAADTFRRSADIHRFVAKQMKEGALIASLNWGHTVLITADLCKGKEIACTWGMSKDIENAGGRPILKAAHRDGNLITSASDSDLPELMRYVVGYLTTVK